MSKKYWTENYCRQHQKYGAQCQGCKADAQVTRAFRRAQVALCIVIGGCRSVLEGEWQAQGQRAVEAEAKLGSISRPSRLGEMDPSEVRLHKEAKARIKEGIPQTTHQGAGKDTLPTNETKRRSEIAYIRVERRSTVLSSAQKVATLTPFDGEFCEFQEWAHHLEHKKNKGRLRRKDRKVKGKQQGRRLDHPMLDATTCLWMGVANPAKEKPASEARFFQSMLEQEEFELDICHARHCEGSEEHVHSCGEGTMEKEIWPEGWEDVYLEFTDEETDITETIPGGWAWFLDAERGPARLFVRWLLALKEEAG